MDIWLTHWYYIMIYTLGDTPVSLWAHTGTPIHRYYDRHMLYNHYHSFFIIYTCTTSWCNTSITIWRPQATSIFSISIFHDTIFSYFYDISFWQGFLYFFNFLIFFILLYLYVTFMITFIIIYLGTGTTTTHMVIVSLV